MLEESKGSGYPMLPARGQTGRGAGKLSEDDAKIFRNKVLMFASK